MKILSTEKGNAMILILGVSLVTSLMGLGIMEFISQSRKTTKQQNARIAIQNIANQMEIYLNDPAVVWNAAQDSANQGTPNLNTCRTHIGADWKGTFCPLPTGNQPVVLYEAYPFCTTSGCSTNPNNPRRISGNGTTVRQFYDEKGNPCSSFVTSATKQCPFEVVTNYRVTCQDGVDPETEPCGLDNILTCSNPTERKFCLNYTVSQALDPTTAGFSLKDRKSKKDRVVYGKCTDDGNAESLESCL